METKKEVRNKGYQTKELCPFTDFCLFDHNTYGNCRGREHYQHCPLYQWAIKCEIKFFKKGLQERVLFHKLLEEAREKLDMGRLRYHEDLAKREAEKKAEKPQKSMPPLREKALNL